MTSKIARLFLQTSTRCITAKTSRPRDQFHHRGDLQSNNGSRYIKEVRIGKEGLRLMAVSTRMHKDVPIDMQCEKTKQLLQGLASKGPGLAGEISEVKLVFLYRKSIYVLKKGQTYTEYG